MRFTASGACVAALAIMLVGSAVHATASYGDVAGRRMLQIPDGEEFPPNCACDRNSSNSPYRLQQTNSTIFAPGYNVYCFKIVKVGCSPTSPCCTSTGVHKVEFQIDSHPGCKSSLKRVTVNGELDSFEYNSNMGTLRVTGLNLTDEAAVGTTICFYLLATGNCSTFTDMCYPAGSTGCTYAIFNPKRDCCPVDIVTFYKPPPPPQFVPIVPAFAQPPPPPVFPTCTCDRDPANSRMALSPEVAVTTLDNGWTQMCFTVTTKETCAPGSPCCTYQLYKLEFAADINCARSFMNATVNGVRATRSFQTRPYPALKVTSLAVPFDQVDGLQACIVLRPPCTTLRALGTNPDGSISVGLFNAPGPGANCCPIYDLSDP